MEWGHTTIYPNQYICLIGPSGVRKGEPLTIAQTLLDRIPRMQMVAEAITKQALIKRIKESMDAFSADDRMAMQCAVTILAEEFAIFLGDNDTGFLADLTAWYDARGKWTYETKHSGKDEIIGVCVNILASMAPDWIPVSIPTAAIGGGFTSRILFVVETQKGRTIADPGLYQIDEGLFDDLVHDLERIHSIVGPYTFDKEAKEHYMEWYIKQEKNTQAGRPALKDPRFSGYVSRRQTYIKKIAMACSASRSDDRIITEADFRRARLFLEGAEKNMEGVFGKVGKNVYVGQTQEVMEFIRSKGKVSKAQIMQAFYRDIDGKSFDIIEATMLATQMVRRTLSTQDGEAIYEWRS